MRAVAVVLVLLYHAGVPGINGGFIGVDVFFVVSGFLITGLILRELDRTGTVSLVAFYARRARRLLPAALLVLAVTVAFSAVFLPPLRVPDISADAAAAALYVSNLRFAFQSTDYLASELAPSPILHYWSLGVEEQFYLFWPALLLAISLFRPRTIRPIAIAVGTVTVVSLAFAIWLTGVAGPWAFFSLPARAWELGLGALVTIGAARLATLPRTWASPISMAGLLLVLIGAVVITTDTPFPGTAAILPVVGAALVLAGGTVSTESPVARALSTRPMRFLGRISYSLYLWHWPILVLPAAALETDLPLIVRVALALLTIPIAAASQRWVEDPIRHGRFVGFRPTRNLAFAGALSLTVALASTAIGLGLVPGTATASLASEDGGPSTDPGLEPLGTPEPSAGVGGSAAPATPPVTGVSATVGGPVPSNLRPTLRDVRSDEPRTYEDGCHLDFATITPGTCAYGATSSKTTIVLFGDSHAAQWFPALERLAVSRGYRLLSFTKSACPAVDVSVYNSDLKRTYTECDAWRAGVLTRIVSEGPALVIISDSRGHAVVSGGKQVDADTDTALWKAGLARTIREVKPSGAQVAVIGDTPRSSFDVPVCVSSHMQNWLGCSTPAADAVDTDWLAVEQGTATKAGASFVDPTAWVCPSDPCPAVIGRYLVYRDTHHMTTPFAASLAPMLEAALPAFTH